MLKIYNDILQPFRRLDAAVILFGSVASGESYTDSDIDIAVITESSDVKEQARELADKVLFEYGKVISLIFFTEEELKKRRNWPFERDVLSGVVLNDKRGIIKSLGGRRD